MFGDKKASGMGLAGLLMLVGVFVVGIVEGIEPFCLGIISSAKAGTASDAVLINVDYESAKTDRPIFIGVSTSRQTTGFGHSANSERRDGNGRAVYAEDMRTGNENRSANRIGAFGGLQWAQHSVANVLYFNMTFDNLRITATDIGDYVSQLNVSDRSARGKTLNLADNELWSLAGDKFRLSSLYGLCGGVGGCSGGMGQTDREYSEDGCKNCNNYSAKSSDDRIFVSDVRANAMSERWDHADESGDAFFKMLAARIILGIGYYALLKVQ
jgi:hypothetical protein